MTTAKTPFDDAVAVWHMGDAEGTGGCDAKLTPVGHVTVGVELAGAEKDASLRRGGDGRVAVFDGGHLVAGASDDAVQLAGNEMTLCIRLLDTSGAWKTSLFSKDDPDDEYAAILYGVDGRLEHLWRTEPAERRIQSPPGDNKEFHDGVLRIGVPADFVGADQWHDVIARFRGPNLELFVDGVLVDEEWPHGDLYRFCGPFLIGAAWANGEIASGFRGMIDHVALWNRALTDDEITALSGGHDEVGQRELDVLGPAANSPQYWRPRGYNTYAGDCMLLSHDGRVHLFYLFDRRQHTAKWYLGAHQYGHWSTTDLVHWEHHPMVLAITDGWECALGTGDFIHHDGTYYAFYTDCGGRCQFNDKPHAGDGIFIATSKDGVNYTKQPRPAMPGGDCTIFRDATTGLFHVLTPGSTDDGRGGLVDFVSEDMQTWTKQSDLFLEAAGCCPHTLKWNDWHYLLMGNRVWMSRQPLGPWTERGPDQLVQLEFPKTTLLDDGRAITAAWVGDAGWGGDVVVRELVQHDDGTLGTKFVAEMIPPSGEPLDLPFEALGGGSMSDGAIHIQSQDGFTAAMLTDVPLDVRVTLTVRPKPGARRFGLCVRGEGDYANGCELRFEPENQLVQYGTPRDGGLADESTGPWNTSPDFTMGGVPGLGRAFTLDIIATGTIIDACIDGRRTIIARRRERGDRLFFFVDGGDVTFEDIKVRPLLQS